MTRLNSMRSTLKIRLYWLIRYIKTVRNSFGALHLWERSLELCSAWKIKTITGLFQVTASLWRTLWSYVIFVGSPEVTFVVWQRNRVKPRNYICHKWYQSLYRVSRHENNSGQFSLIGHFIAEIYVNTFYGTMFSQFYGPTYFKTGPLLWR